MSTLLMHPYDYLKIHFHTFRAAGQVNRKAETMRRVLDLTEHSARIAFVITVTYLAVCCFAKLVEAATLNSLYWDLCTAMPIMMVAP